jgi:hypothetical protein
MKTITISKGNVKLGKLANFSLPPVVSCPNCKDCKGIYKGRKYSCYANKAMRLYPSAKNAWYNNFEACTESLENVERQICEFLRKNLPPIFRIHTAGDFYSQDYVAMWIRIAKRFSDVKFLAFTKAYKLNYRTKSRNLKIIYSVMPATKLSDVPRGTRAYAGRRPITNKRIFDCPGNCENCGICWNLTASENVFFELH